MTLQKTITEAQLAAALAIDPPIGMSVDERAGLIFAALPDDGLDVERLARALEAVEKADLIVLLGKPLEGRLDFLDAPLEAAAAIIAALREGGQP